MYIFLDRNFFYLIKCSFGKYIKTNIDFKFKIQHNRDGKDMSDYYNSKILQNDHKYNFKLISNFKINIKLVYKAVQYIVFKII